MSWQDQGYWLLLPLLAVAAFAFRRGGALAALLVGLSLPWTPAHAADNWWRRPDQQAHAQLERGARSYRHGDFDAAARTWRALPGADAAYNLGNALAKGGDYAGAVSAYDRALRVQPGMQDAIANRAAVLKAMRRRPQPSGGSGQNQPGGQRQAQSQPQQGQPPKGQQAQQAQQNASQRDARNTRQQAMPQQQAAQQPGTAQSQRPADAEAQRRADAAQRTRMQQALARAKVRATDKPAGRTETPAEREQRLADDAWLRRIPDDPGALLRARFQLEHERRLQQGGPP